MNDSDQPEKRDKHQIRGQVLRMRELLSDARRIEKDQLIHSALQTLPELIRARHIFCYVSIKSEPATPRLIDWLLSAGKQVSVPKLLQSRQIIAVPFPGWTNLHTGTFGLAEPESSLDVSADVDVCLIPGIAYDLNGNRLGHGAGLYDRWLDRYPVSNIIAPAYDCQILDEIPVDKHDKKVDLIVSETRIIRP